MKTAETSRRARGFAVATRRTSGARDFRAQRGVSLLFSLIAVVALALAAIALTRSVNTGALIVGNLGFKQDALQASNQATETAIAWLQANLAGTVLYNDVPAQGYYATSLTALDPTGNQTTNNGRAVVDWNGDGCASISGAYASCIAPSAGAAAGNGDTASYVITRLCHNAGDPTASTNSCALSLDSASVDNQNRNDPNYGRSDRQSKKIFEFFYRVIVRTVGPRGTTAYTETIFQM
jgi:Tfp pilus assembly protein PilX